MKKLFFLALCLCNIVAFAQKAPQEVTLVVSADGATKTQAIDNALRSAIEQTFGTFVSANTEILNDELVKDEVATVSSGNIQKYKEVASVILPNGSTSVTLDVVVSLKKLVKYAQSKGSECEFAGATFGANKRMYDFNKRNEEIAIDNLIKQLAAMRPVYDYDIEVSDPMIGKDGTSGIIEMQVTVKSNDKTKQFDELIENTLMSLAMTAKQIKPMADAGFSFTPYVLILDGKISKIKKDKYEKYHPQENQIFYFYSETIERLDWALSDAMYDFHIKDNNGSEFLLIDLYQDFFYSKQDVLGHRFIYNGREEKAVWGYQNTEYHYQQKSTPAPVVNTHIGRQFERGTIPKVKAVFALNKTPIMMIIPHLSFTVPIESINLISRITISPSTQERTCFLVDEDIKRKQEFNRLVRIKHMKKIERTNGAIIGFTLFSTKDESDDVKWMKELKMDNPPQKKLSKREQMIKQNNKTKQ